MIGCSNCGTDVAAEIEKHGRVGAASRVRAWAERKKTLGLIDDELYELAQEMARDLEVGA